MIMQPRGPHLRLRPPVRVSARGSIDLLLVMACAGVGLGAPWIPSEPRAQEGSARSADRTINRTSAPVLRDGRTDAGVDGTTTGVGAEHHPSADHTRRKTP